MPFLGELWDRYGEDIEKIGITMTWLHTNQSYQQNYNNRDYKDRTPVQ